ncbi:MAG: hypothetical protein KUG77_15090 [Nannocystaceae bacterium]|nr:hypothetical protein [Nannocystaceae bacterium]
MSEAETNLVPEPRAPAALLRQVVLGMTAAGVLIAVPVSIRAWVDGHGALEEALSTPDVDLRIERLGHAARWRMPLASHDEEALDALVELGDHSEATVSVAAYREARRALLATRAWGLADPVRFEMLNERIALAMAIREEVEGTDVGGQGDPYAYHLQLLAREPGPEPMRAGVAAWAFVGWLGALVGFVGRGLDERGKLQAKPATRWGLAVLLLLAAWTVLLATA